VTAGADWILADALGIEPIDSRAWAIVQGNLRDSLADPSGARAGNSSTMAPLIEGLMLGGFAMQWSKSSRPASGAEHQFSHLWDMEHHVHHGKAPSHGFKVGIATLAITRLYEQLMAHDLSLLDVDACLAAWPDLSTSEANVRRQFARADFVDKAVAETRAKHVTTGELRRQFELLKSRWPEMRDRLREQLLPSDEMEKRLKLVGAPSEPEEIGISRERLRETFWRAYHIRRRFTVLDLTMRAGLLDTLLGGLFGPGAPWEVSTVVAR
jgi:glycerol-1-phosphate dehydrogenase [NAD(P)+]